MKKEQKKNRLVHRIEELCRQKGITYYALAYRSAVPLTTLMHIIDGTTKNPGFYTILKLCEGFGISLAEFVDTEEFQEIGKDI